MKTPSALITGSTSGIGKATALAFAQKGYFVYCHGRSESSDFSVLDEIRSEGGEAKKCVADMAVESEIHEMFQQIDTLSVLVNNAGTATRKKPVLGDDFRKTLEVNLVAPYICCQLAREKGVRSIVNVGSMRGLSQSATTPDYSASKAGLHNLTASLARMYAPDCRVNAVAPGFTKTPLHEGNDERLQMEAKKTPLQTVADPLDIAHSIFFLASEKSRFTTGQVLSVDGGRSFSSN